MIMEIIIGEVNKAFTRLEELRKTYDDVIMVNEGGLYHIAFDVDSLKK